MVALSAADFERAAAEESHSEGIIDQLRALHGTKVAALVRELSSGERKGQHKVSLRATDDDVDVSIIARAQGGGGHRRAAGFSTTLARRGAHRVPARRDRRAAAPEHRRQRRRDGRLSAPRPARRASRACLLIDKPAGMSSHDVVAAVRRSLGGVKAGHAGTLDPFATGLLLVLLGRATKAQKALMELPKRYETVARLGARSSTGDTEGEITETGPPARRPAAAAHGRDPPAPADALGDQDRRRARLQARPPRRELRDARADRDRLALRAALARARRRGRPDASAARRVRDRVRLRHLRALADRRSRRRLLPDAAGAPRSGRSRSRTPRRYRRAASRGSMRRCSRSSARSSWRGTRLSVRERDSPARSRAPRAQRRRRHLRRRAPRPPRGHRGRRQRAHASSPIPSRWSRRSTRRSC